MKSFVLGTVSVLLVTLCLLAFVLGIDVWLHDRFEERAALNIWGYRGPTIGRKAEGEFRIIVVGGSTTFGYGLTPSEAFPPMLEKYLNKVSDRKYSVVNLGMNSQGAYSYLGTMEDYLWLDYDVAIFYGGYNDLGIKNNYAGGRRSSPVFRLTGYYPILPIILGEKAMLLRYGSLDAAYKREKVVFKPNLLDRAAATGLETAKQIGERLEDQLDRFTRGEVTQTADTLEFEPLCGKRTSFYCKHIDNAIKYGLDQKKMLVLVTQPYASTGHREQQAALNKMLVTKYGGEKGVIYINLGDSLDINDARYSFDRMHLTKEGNQKIATALGRQLLSLPQFNSAQLISGYTQSDKRAPVN